MIWTIILVLCCIVELVCVYSHADRQRPGWAVSAAIGAVICAVAVVLRVV